jgi:hypothetical protein
VLEVGETLFIGGLGAEELEGAPEGRVVHHDADAATDAEGSEDDADPGIAGGWVSGEYRGETRDVLFGVVEHVEGFAEGQVAHYVEGSEVVELHHVKLLVGVLLDAFLDLGDEFLRVLQEERLLLLERAV